MKSMIILPTYNERENIEKLVPGILDLKRDFYITIVDDNSPDGTGEAADRLAASHPGIHVIHRPEKSGLGTAYLEGFRYALSKNMDYIFEMDADLSHHPKYLIDMLDAIRDADLVIGSRYYEGVRVDGWRFRRLLLSKFANMYASYMILLPVWDFTSGFRCFRREVLEKLDLTSIRSDGYSFQIEVAAYAYRLGFRIKEIPIIFYGRVSGDSKMSGRIVWEAFWTVIRLRSPLIEIIKHLRFFFKDYSEFVREGKGS
ncbi:MAG: polyprenol monophosphomannose synthase [Nitrospiraceae bacterium]|nr:MAG: polyprenol monophosphomannose synthase [Nitrospiraceae bacterium]